MGIENIIFIMLVAMACSSIILYIIVEVVGIQKDIGMKAVTFLIIGFGLFPTCSIILWEWLVV